MTADAVLALARELIAAPSPNYPGDERAVADVVTDALTARGLPAPSVLAAKAHRPNLLVTLDLGPGGRHLCLAGHMDTKPVGQARWSVDPFAGQVVGDRLYGLGACDMKAALAAMIEAAAATAEEVSRGRLSLLFTADEEQGALYGARYLAESGLVHADGVVIGEPGGIATDFDLLHRVSRGISLFQVVVSGRQAHSSLSDLRPTPSAALALARLLLDFNEGFRPSAPPHPLAPHGATVNAGVTLRGGTGYGTIAGEAAFGVDVRLVPGMDRQTFRADLDGFLAQARERLELSELEVAVVSEPAPRDWLPPTEVPASHPLVACAAAALQSTTGREAPLAMFPGTTDAAWLQGVGGIPTLPALGPGLLERAHAADEYVSVVALEQAVEIYRDLARRYCTGET